MTAAGIAGRNREFGVLVRGQMVQWSKRSSICSTSSECHEGSCAVLVEFMPNLTPPPTDTYNAAMGTAGWAAIGTAAGAVMAFGAMCVAIWQARIANKSSRAAITAAAATTDQAHSARDAATSARKAADAAITQALAATEQARLLRLQLDSALVDRDYRDAPAYSLTPVGEGELGEDVISPDGSTKFTPIAKNNLVALTNWVKHRLLEVCMTAGPAEVSIEVTLAHSYGAKVRILEADPHRMVRRSTKRLTLISPYRLNGQPVEVIICSTELGRQHRTWTCHEEISL